MNFFVLKSDAPSDRKEKKMMQYWGKYAKMFQV